MNYIIIIVSFFFVAGFSSRALAVLAFEVAPQEVDKIVVIGLEAQVQLQGIPQAQKLRVTGVDESSESGQFALEKKGRVLYVKMLSYSDKKEWKEVLSRPVSKKKVIDFTGASVPVEIQLRDGDIRAQKWSKELRLALVKGKFVSTGGTASVAAQVQTGEITILDQHSKVSADIYKGQLLVKNLQGDLEASVFSGILNIEKVKGFMQISVAQATAKILQSIGTLQYENVKGVVITQQFAGRIEGQSSEGNVNFGILADSDVYVKSASGRVTVQTAPGSGAMLNLATSDGEIAAPSEVRVLRAATEKSVRGRLRGAEQKGTVFVRTQEGQIVVK